MPANAAKTRGNRFTSASSAVSGGGGYQNRPPKHTNKPKNLDDGTSADSMSKQFEVLNSSGNNRAAITLSNQN